MITISAIIISQGNIYEIGDRLLKIEFSGQDRSDILKPSWGIMSNSGFLEMYDSNGIMRELHKNGLLIDSKIRIRIALKKNKQIGEFYVSSFTNDSKTLITKIGFRDILYEWSKKAMPKYLNRSFIINGSSQTFYSAKEIIDSIIKMADVSLRYQDEATKSYLQNINIPFASLSEGSLWNQMSKICEFSGCYIFCDKGGVPNIKYCGGT